MTPELVTQLRDIKGLDVIPAWPPAMGWWLLAALIIVLVVLLILLIKNLRRFPVGSWRRDARNQLRTLKRQASGMTVNQLASDLSELLRRIAIAQFGRDQAASLNGEDWLAWLHKHDPAGFDWTSHGKLLLTLPYTPSGLHEAGKQQLYPLIDAALAWTDRGNKDRS